MNVVGRINGGFLLVEMQSVELKDLLLAARALKDVLASVEAFLEPTGALPPPPPACAPPVELQSMAGPPPTQPTLNRAGDSICIGCNKPFVRKRKDQKCCSAKCRRKNVDRQPGKHADKEKGFHKVCTICVCGRKKQTL